MIWNDEQNNTLKLADQWFKSKSRQQIFRIFGFAGVGKTALAKHFADNIDGEVLFAAFTGKAALVLSKMGCRGASTIHSLIYKTTVSKEGLVSFDLDRNSIVKSASLIIIDECSMVDAEIGKDLLSFNKPILVLGDPAQLPPIEGAGFFTNVKPDVMLTQIHRQARDNPIIDLATRVRQKERLSLGKYGDSIVTDKINIDCFLEKDQVLVGRNATRTSMNQRARKRLGFDSEDPMLKEKLICLRNDSPKGIYNGGTFNIVQQFDSKRPLFYKLGLVDDVDSKVAGTIVTVHKSFLRSDVSAPNWKFLKGTQQFDYGYAITGHKSQGSQWPKVLVYDESFCFGQDWWRWLYTCITRAQETVEIVIK